jgi:uncharacterized protein YecE (DUF72 family)
MPEPHIVANYAESVPDDFKFTIKLPNALTLTHYYRSKKLNPYFLNPEFFNEFIKLISALHNKLGPLMFQFEYMNNNTQPLMNRLKKSPSLILRL